MNAWEKEKKEKVYILHMINATVIFHLDYNELLMIVNWLVD